VVQQIPAPNDGNFVVDSGGIPEIDADLVFVQIWYCCYQLHHTKCVVFPNKIKKLYGKSGNPKRFFEVYSEADFVLILFR